MTEDCSIARNIVRAIDELGYRIDSLATSGLGSYAYPFIKVAEEQRERLITTLIELAKQCNHSQSAK